jgi:renal tumor antigen
MLPLIVFTLDHRQAANMKFNFPPKSGTGLAKLLPHAPQECLELLTGMLQYDPDARYSARQCVKHAYFKDLRFVSIIMYFIFHKVIVGI